jgi:hypothetical protein
MTKNETVTISGQPGDARPVHHPGNAERLRDKTQRSKNSHASAAR